MTKKTRRTISYSITAAFFVATLVAMLILRNYQFIAEWWTMNISRHWVATASTVSGLVPFSIFEWFIIFAVFIGLFCIIAGIAMLCRKKFHTFFNCALATVIAVLVITNLYTMSAGFSYYRNELPIVQYQQEINYEQALKMRNFYANDFNNLSKTLKRDEKGDIIMPYSPKELIAKINQEFDKLDKNYFFDNTSTTKPILNSWFMTQTNIYGVSFLPTGEANYNNDIHLSSKPFTIAHEIAHQRGVMREGDANTISESIMLNSDDNYIRYCGYFEFFGNFTSLANSIFGDMTEEEFKKFTPLDNEITVEMKNSVDLWHEQRNNPLSKFIGKISIFFNDIYLKLNGLNDGTGDYDNSGEHVDSGETDDDGNIIYKYEISAAERMYYQIYLNKLSMS